MTLGASNVSFGMPGRHAIGAAFLPMAMAAGLTSAIMDARSPQIVEAVQAADLLLDHDEWGVYGSPRTGPARPRAVTRPMSARDDRPTSTPRAKGSPPGHGVRRPATPG